MQTSVTQAPERKKLRPMFIGALIGMHLLALAAPFTFSWEGFLAFLIMVQVTGCLGITLCYHRLLTHRSFKTHKFVKGFLMLCGTLSFEGSPSWWVASHRVHHRESDQPKDPHSPVQDGIFWSHVGWLMYDDPRMLDEKTMRKHIPDMIDDPWAKFLHNNFVLVNTVFLLGISALGYALGGPQKALSMFIWGGALRIVWVWHITWLVNSMTHVSGYRNYETRDGSRNNWLVGILAFGEGWHNNHHAMPSTARAGHKWWEIDQTYGILKLMEMTGLAWKIVPIGNLAPASIEPLSTPPRQDEKTTVGLR